MKISLFLMVLFVLIVAVAPAQAQSIPYGACYKTDTLVCPPCGDFVPPGWIDAISEAPYLALFVYPGSCAPPRAADENRCVQCELAAAAAAAMPEGSKPIALASGNTYVKQSDVSLPGLGGGLSLIRTWNSYWPPSQVIYKNFGIFGPNWRSTYEESVFQDPNDGYIRYARGDGNFWSLGVADDNVGMGPGEFKYAIAAPGSTSAHGVAGFTRSGNVNVCSFSITLPGGEKRNFTECPYATKLGKLSSIVDRNGNTTSLHYDAAGRLDTVTDAVGRHLYFAYGTGAYTYLVSSVTSDSGRGINYTYAYDTATVPKLVKITRPDNTFITFEYDANALISAVKDMNGKVLETHTYDAQSRGLTGSEANGVNAVTVSYPPQ